MCAFCSRNHITAECKLKDKKGASPTQLFLDTHNVDVACISETKLAPTKKCYIRNYKIYRVDREARGGGLAIIVKNTMRTSSIRSETQPTESVGIKIATSSAQWLNIFSAYSPPSDSDLSGIPALFGTTRPQ